MTKRNEEILKEKLQFYKDRDESVHLVLKMNPQTLKKQFRNGKTRDIKEGSIVFDDEVLGVVLIYFSELVDVQKREAKR